MVWTALAAAAANGLMSWYANGQSQRAMARYRNALSADRARAAQKENYLENVDPLQTKSGQALATDMAERLREQGEAAAGRNAVMGGGGHNTAATKDANAQLMSAYQRSLIRQHEMNVVPRLNYYRSQYDRANQALEKAEVDRATSNINAASQAAQGMVNAVAAGANAGLSATDEAANAANAASGNGTTVGNIKSEPQLGFVPKGIDGNPLQMGVRTDATYGPEKPYY